MNKLFFRPLVKRKFNKKVWSKLRCCFILFYFWSRESNILMNGTKPKMLLSYKQTAFPFRWQNNIVFFLVKAKQYCFFFLVNAKQYCSAVHLNLDGNVMSDSPHAWRIYWAFNTGTGSLKWAG